MKNRYTLQWVFLFALSICGLQSAHAQCTILGDTSACQAGTETYSIENPNAGSIYVWSVTSGGTIVGPNAGTSVDITWGNTVGSHTVSASEQIPGPTTTQSIDLNTQCLDLETGVVVIKAPLAICPAGDLSFSNSGAPGSAVFLIPAGGASAAVVVGGDYATGNRCLAEGLTYSSLAPTTPFSPGSVFYVLTSSGNYFKIGNIAVSNTNVTFDYAQLDDACGPDDCSLNVNTEGDATLSCNDLVHISMDENCRATVTGDMVLEGETLPNSSYIVTIYMPNGSVIPNATLTSAHVGMNLEYRVTQECTGNTCWGRILVEDKLIPLLECRTDTIERMCGESLDPEDVGFPLPMGTSAVRVPGQNEFVVSGFDPCGDIWLTYSDEVEQLGCGSEYYTLITRVWSAVDVSGNKTGCKEVLGITPGTLAGVVFPPNYDGITLFALECDFKDKVARGPRAGIGSMSVNIGWNSLDNGLPSPYSVRLGGADSLIGTGFPTGAECDHIAVSYRDRVIETCGPNTYKLFRTWKVYDWCTGDDTTYLQLIKVVDTRAPQLICNPNNLVEVIPNTPWTCTGTFIAPEPIFDPKASSGGSVPVIIGECSGWTYEVRHKIADESGDNPGDCVNIPTSGAFFTNNVRRLPNGQYEIFDMPFGCNWIEYIITDDCGNASTCRFDIFVEDTENPVAVCDEHTVVSLNESGEAEMCAQVVDNGSQDNCTAQEDLTFQIKRMGESDARFRDCITFNCLDVPINPIMVVFRVFDERGNYNDCMVEVEVQDKIAPKIECPDDIRITCDMDFNDPAVTGVPTTSDQCGNPTITSQITRDSRNDCGIGFVIKRWRVEDASGRFAVCDQRIDIYDADPFDGSDIIWPRNIDIDGCTVTEAHPNNLPAGAGWPDYRNRDCAKPVAGYTDDVFYNVNGNCIEIHRKWEVIDWCQYDLVNNTGPKWTMHQIIGINNTEAPNLENGHCENRTVCTDSDCLGWVEFNMTATDDCTLEEDLEWSYSVRDAATNTLLESGTGNTYLKKLERGRYSFTWRVKDACGNEDDCRSIVTIEDCKEPTPYCKPGIITTIMPSSGYVEVWASDLNDGSFDNCTDTSDLRFSFSADVRDTGRRITCDSLENGIEDTFYYRMYVTDLDGNQDFCRVTIIVQDNQDRCPNSGNLNGMVAGLVKTTIDDEVESVQVNLLHNDVQEKMLETQLDGKYQFDGLELMDKYEVAPYKNDDHLNGVTTADLVMIQRHLLGLTTFTSPYQYIAADANNNEDVSASDISEVRKLILGAIPAFRQNTSWRFIDSDQTFQDDKNPWDSGLKESHTFAPLSGMMMGYDFVAVKVGDVNDSASPSGATSNSGRTSSELTVNVVDRSLAADEYSMIRFEAGQDITLLGLQMTISLGEHLNITNLEAGLMNVTQANYHVHANGDVTFSWDQVNGLEVQKGDVLFEVQIMAGAEIQLSDELKITSQLTRAEAYDQDLVAHDVELRFSQSITNENITLYQNIPNPFNGSTMIPFDLPQAAEAQLTIFDVTGKVLLTVFIEGQKGYNEFEISTAQIGQSGVLYYQLESNQKVATKRMLSVE